MKSEWGANTEHEACVVEEKECWRPRARLGTGAPQLLRGSGLTALFTVGRGLLELSAAPPHASLTDRLPALL